MLIVLGAFATTLATPNLNLDKDVTIPVGPAYFVIRVNAFAGMSLSVSYTLASSGTIDVYVIDESAYAIYSYSLYAPSSLYEDTNTTHGNFNLVISAGGTYYVVMNHHLGITGDQQTLHVVATASGVNFLYVGTGVGMMVTGAVLGLLALRGRRAFRENYGVLRRRRSF